MLIESFWPSFLDTVAGARHSSEVFAEVERIAARTVGVKLFTASVLDMRTRRSRRVYTNDEAAYPTGGYKPIEDNAWTERVLKDHQPYRSLSIEEMAEVLFDWEKIQALGYESNCNIPVVAASEVVGTLNLLDVAGSYDDERVEKAMALRPFGLVAFLMAARENAGTPSA